MPYLPVMLKHGGSMELLLPNECFSCETDTTLKRLQLTHFFIHSKLGNVDILNYDKVHGLLVPERK